MLKNPTIELLRTIGSPLVTLSLPDVEESLEIYEHAVKNKIPLLYMDALKKQGRLNKLKSEYEQRYTQHLNFRWGAAKVSRVLGDAGIKHVIIKSIKLYPASGGDLDVLVFGKDDSYRQAVKVLLKAGYVTAVPQVVGEIVLNDEDSYDKAVKVLTTPTYGKDDRISPTGTDFTDPEYNVFVDLQKDMALSHIVYLNKGNLGNGVIKATVLNGQEASIPAPEYDLLTVIAHSLMEQLFLLGEFYTFLYQLSNMDEGRVINFINIVKKNRLRGAVRTFATITAELYKASFGDVPAKLELILHGLGSEKSEAKSLLDSDFKMPHRYRITTLAKIFLEKLSESRFGRTMAKQVIKTLDPRLARLVILELTEMRRRETYLKEEQMRKRK